LKVENATCPNCGSAGMRVVYEQRDIPVHSCLLMPSREAAVSYPHGNLVLGFCDACGFLSNLAFDPSVHEYSAEYEETQGFSPTFNAFARDLAARWVERYDLRDKDIIEIGCGKGEFLVLLCELGGNRGVGFDPSYIPERTHSSAAERIQFIRDFYSERYTDIKGEFVCCRHTLEHIHPTYEFMQIVRRTVGERLDTIVAFELPDVSRVLRETAFWDIYYEHCSYFSLGSLARLFRSCGFDVLDLRKEYDDQYLIIEAKPASGAPSSTLPGENDLEQLREEVSYFAGHCREKIAFWRDEIHTRATKGQRVVLWGGSSKGVAFLTTLKLEEGAIEYAVDINPHKHGHFMPGTGQEVVPPEFLKDYHPQCVIVMNPIYREEIQKDLDRLGVHADLLTV